MYATSKQLKSLGIFGVTPPYFGLDIFILVYNLFHSSVSALAGSEVNSSTQSFTIILDWTIPVLYAAGCRTASFVRFLEL